MRAIQNIRTLRPGILVMLAALVALTALPAAAQYNYFPGGPAVNDGRTVALAGDQIETLAQDSLTFLLAVPVGVEQFELGIFDGETGLADGAGQRHWDNGATQLQYALFYDPYQQGSTDPSNLIGVWRGNETNPVVSPEGEWVADSAVFPDNDWWNLTINVPIPPEPQPGQAPSGATFYHLCVSYRSTTGNEMSDPCTGDARPADLSPQTIANFKIRATSNISVLSFAFAYEGAMRASGTQDVMTIYPEFTGALPSPDFFLVTPTTYDGHWTFELDVPTSRENVVLYGGDFDFGTLQTVGFPSGAPIEPCFDTDDPDTPNTTSFPDFVVGPGGARMDDSLPEGARANGVPADDNRLDVFRRSPCIRWTLTSPGADGDIETGADNVVYANANPSSQREWEQFRVSSEASCDSSPACDPLLGNCADYCEADLLPAGVWRVQVEGVDLSNLNAWRSDSLSGFCINCGLLPRPYLVGDTVFADLDGDGEQDAGEPGISGVRVELLDDRGSVIDTVTTGDAASHGASTWASCQMNNTGTGTAVDEDGLYCFNVLVPNENPDGIDSEAYSVRIADSNFEPGGALYDYFGASPLASRPSPEQSGTVVEQGGNVMTYDFGYYVPFGSVGDRVWYDADGDGEQDGGETGLNGVTVRLYDGDGNELASQVTSGDGEYLFEDLEAGDYRVAVDASTLPAGLAQTYDLDGLASRNEASFTLASAEHRRDVDFGYDDCAPCDGKVTRLVLQYQGSSSAWVKVKAKKGSKYEYVFEGTLAPGDVFEIVGPDDHRGGFSGTLGTEVKFYVDGDYQGSMHTSCSVPIGPGTVSGDFVVVSGESKNGGLLCPLDGGGCTDCGGGGGCPADLDFETDADGHALPAGTLIDDEWADLGIHVTTDDPQRHPAMIFDSAHPTGGDPDLGSPNEDFGGPGVGNGGKAGSAYVNRNALGKILIVSEDGHHWDPDDDANGGRLIFTFDDPLDVTSLDFVDIEESGGYVKAYDEAGAVIASVSITKTGNNGFATVPLDASDVSRLEVKLKGSGGLAEITFCAEDEQPEPEPEPEPCAADLDFETGANGQSLQTGQYISDQWASAGIQVTTHDGWRHPAMIFDSSRPTGGDDDLGTPNQKFGGPGKGRGGESGTSKNTVAEGKVLIISEDGHHWDPDDDANGGWIIFTYDDPATVASVSLIDIEDRGGQVRAYDASWSPIVIKEIPQTGDNGVVTVDVTATGVKHLKVWLKGSGAISRVRFCADGGNGGSAPGGNTQAGTGTIGYWKNHAEAWPVQSLHIGPFQLSKQQALQVLNDSPRGNKVLILGQQLIATKLNLANGTEASCIEDVVEDADRFIQENPPWSWLSWWEEVEAEELKDELDEYNNGRLCAPHRG